MIPRLLLTAVLDVDNFTLIVNLCEYIFNDLSRTRIFPNTGSGNQGGFSVAIANATFLQVVLKTDMKLKVMVLNGQTRAPMMQQDPERNLFVASMDA
jgi:hypothetical protein